MNRRIDVSGNHTFSEVLQANDITNVHANTGGAPATFSVYYNHKTGTVDIRMKVASQEQTATRLKDTCDHKPITGLGKCEYLPRTGGSVVDEPSSYCQLVPLDISTPHRKGSKDSTHGSEDMPLLVRKNYFPQRHHESGDDMVEGGDDVTPIGQTLGEYRKSYTTAVQDHSEWQPRSTISSLISNSAGEDIIDEASISAAQRVEIPAADIPDTRPQERPNLVIPQNEVASASDVRRVDEYSQPITRVPPRWKLIKTQQTNEINDSGNTDGPLNLSRRNSEVMRQKLLECVSSLFGDTYDKDLMENAINNMIDIGQSSQDRDWPALI